MKIYKLIATLIFILNGYNSLAQYCCDRIEISIRDDSGFIDDNTWTPDRVRVANQYKITITGFIKTGELYNVYENLVSKVDSQKIEMYNATLDAIGVRVVVDFIVGNSIEKSLIFYKYNAWSFEPLNSEMTVYKADYEILCAINGLFPKTFRIKDEELCHPY